MRVQTLSPGKTYPGRELCDDDWLYFVHGAITDDPATLDPPTDGGSGDYGDGFYTFEICEGDDALSIRRAKERAYQKAKDANKYAEKGDPAYCAYLVYVKMRRATYNLLDRYPIEDEQKDEWQGVYERCKHGHGFLGMPIIIAPLLHRGGKEIQVGYPRQVKFEKNGTTSLEVAHIYEVT